MTAQRPQHFSAAMPTERGSIALGQLGMSNDSSPGLHLVLAQGHHLHARESASYPAADVRMGGGDDSKLRHSGSVREADCDFRVFHDALSLAPARDVPSPATEHLCDIVRLPDPCSDVLGYAQRPHDSGLCRLFLGFVVENLAHPVQQLPRRERLLQELDTRFEDSVV
jgi:hypothetical protein